MSQTTPQYTTHPRTIGWIGTTSLAIGGSNQSLFLIGALIMSQGSAAIPLLIIGLLLSWAAAPGWTELVLMWPNRVGGIASSCAEAFRPYSPILANLTGVCYWWGWIPTCGLTAILSASAISQWYLPHVPVPLLATLLVLGFTAVNLCGIRWVTLLAVPFATASALLAFLSGLIPILSGHVNWHQAMAFHLISPFPGFFGSLTSAMAGLYLVGFAAPAFEAATCHVGETINPQRNVPRAVFASGCMAFVYFAFLPVIWLGVLGPIPLMGDLAQTLGPTYAPWFGSMARAIAIWFMMFNMFHGTLQPLAGASRTLSQLAEDGLIPHVFARRLSTDTPWVATLLTAGMAIIFLLTGDPTWVIAAANLTYLIGICLPNVAVWLLRRDAPEMTRLYRAPRGTIILGLIASAIWGLSTLLGFEQFGLPTVIAGLAFAYSGCLLYALRRWSDRRRVGQHLSWRSLHLKLTGSMLLVLSLDSIGYLLALKSIKTSHPELITGLEDIFVAVALLTISVGLVLPGMISHAVGEVAQAADRLSRNTLTDLAVAMQALKTGDFAHARVKVDISPVVVHSHDEVGAMAISFNTMQALLGSVAISLTQASDGLIHTYEQLKTSNTDLQIAHDELATLARSDPLTGLLNHRAINQILEETVKTNLPCSVLFIDLDHFKNINDTRGHMAGDATLCEFGDIVKHCLRNTDSLSRWGGEEFLAVLPGANKFEARHIAEKIRSNIAQHIFCAAGNSYLTCSLGVTGFPQDAQDCLGLIETADHAMYTAKKMGRNQVCLADEPTIKLLNYHSVTMDSREEATISATAEGIAILLDARDYETGEHTKNVALISMQMALTMGFSDTEILMVGLAARLHDLGKIAIPDAILHKASKLTPEEWAIVKAHPVVGANAVNHIPALQTLAPAIRSHHERWDGQGYPDHLGGEDIPFVARIITVADAYGVLTMGRPYRKATSPGDALHALMQCAGTQFDPFMLATLQKVLVDTEQRNVQGMPTD